ncbi:ubiquitin-like domain-containing CTD phosphatase 1, partial [Phenoliferia sp. Uapishka_3]
MSTSAPGEAGPSVASVDDIAALTALDQLPDEIIYALIMSWKATKYAISIVQSDTVGDLKAQIWSLVSVPPQRQKILGLVKGKLPPDEVEVSTFLTEGKTKEFMMVGTPEGEEHKETNAALGVPEVDIDYAAKESKAAQSRAVWNVRNRCVKPEASEGVTSSYVLYRRKLKEAADALGTIDLMNQPREGKKLLVLDLDGCILDTGLWKESNFVAEHFARPFLHDFLRAISPYYDIVIWSQTSWRWLETKLVELNLVGDDKAGDYNIIFVLDRAPMFSVYSERNGQPFKHEVKALGIIWSKFPQYGPETTIHVDDLSRNFALNVNNGLKVHAYRDAMVNQSTDRELAYVARYMLQLAAMPDVDMSKLDHSRFRKLDAPLPEGVEDPVKNWKRPTEE